VEQLDDEPDAEFEGERLGEGGFDRVLDSDEVQVSREDGVLRTENVGPSKLPEKMPDCEFEPDAVSDDVALEDDIIERVTESVLHAVDDGLIDTEIVELPHTEELGLMDDVRHSDDDGEKNDVALPLCD
jgi:hypothetical protein